MIFAKLETENTFKSNVENRKGRFQGSAKGRKKNTTRDT